MGNAARRIAVTNVRVFDGRQLLPPGTVVIEGARIGSDASGAESVDGAGGVLLPGLIDAHVHVRDRHALERLSGFGVTTALDMACAPPELVDSLRAVRGLTDIRSAGTPAIAPGSPHSRIPVTGQRGLISGPEQAAQFVADRVAEGSDYLKIVIGRPAPSHDQATLDALTAAAREHGKLTVAHASSYESVEMAQLARVNVLTHVPLDKALDETAAARAIADGRILVPTLTMMEGVIAQSAPPGADYDAARQSVTVMYRAGVPILAGTDANVGPGVPATISHGDSLHHELELLVDAGLSTLDALRAATSRPAHYFGLADRGVIEPGRRADLVLVDANPLQDITATQSIRRIWCAGIEVAPVPSPR
ncbi:MAG: amidohydrolase family protein [Actinomycetota bacterium]|nr:amidohydrolase family protein [Actinomycetota bacterium]